MKYPRHDTKPHSSPSAVGAWPHVKLGDVCSFKHGGTPSKANSAYWSGTIPWISPKDMAVELIADGEDHISEEAVESSATRVVDTGALLTVVRSGILARRVPLAVVGARVAFNQDIKAILPALNRLDVQYLFLALRAAEPRILANGIKKGATVHSFRTGFLEELEIPLPPIREQKLIAARLNARLAIIARAKAAAEERLRAANTLAGAYVIQEFGNGKSKQWPRRPLKAISLGNGQYGTSQKSYPTELPGTVPVLGIGNIKRGVIAWTRLKFALLIPDDVAKYRLKSGDLLFCRTNSAELVGETAVFDGARDAAFASYLVRFRVNPALADPRFISTYINGPSGRHFIQQRLSRAIGQANVSASVVAEMEIPTPPVAVQRSIMVKLAQATAVTGPLVQQISEEVQSLDRMPGALLRAAFNGDA